MKRNGLLALIAGAVLVSVLASGCASPQQQRREFLIQKVSQKLDLSDAQKAMLRGLQSNMMAVMKSGANEHMAAVRDFIALVKSDSIDPMKLDAIRVSMQSNRDAVRAAFQSNFIEFHKTLTPAQKEKLANWIEHMHAKMREMMQ